jgi:prevent-host-death family protein
MATAIAPTKTSEVSIAEAKARLSELVRRAELNGETITITRRGKPVVTIQSVSAEGEQPERRHWIYDMAGLFADHPEVCDEIDRVYAERSRHMPRQIEL